MVLVHFGSKCLLEPLVPPVGLWVPWGFLVGASWMSPGCFLAGSWLPGALGLTFRLIDQGSLG